MALSGKKELAKLSLTSVSRQGTVIYECRTDGVASSVTSPQSAYRLTISRHDGFAIQRNSHSGCRKYKNGHV